MTWFRNMTYYEWALIMCKELKEWKKTAPILTDEEAYKRLRGLGYLTTDRESRMKILNVGLWITATLVDFDEGYHLDARPCFLNKDGRLRKMKIGPLAFEL